MRAHERLRGLTRAPRLVWDVLARGRYAFVYDRIPMAPTKMSLAKRLNLVRAGANLAYRRLHPWSMPLHMQFELVCGCNLRCPVCPTGRREIARPAMLMEPALFERVMEEVGPYLLTMSLWGWGEPLLHPRLREILTVARRFPVATLLSTNGQRLADARVQEAIREAPPHHLIVALDGLTDDTNSQYRAGAQLAPALDGVRQLAEWKRRTGARLPLLHMRFIAMAHNEHELPGIEDFARQHAFDLATLRGLSIIDHEQPDEVVRSLLPRAADWRAYTYRGDRRYHRDDFICQNAFWFPTLLSDGTVVACEQDFDGRHAIGRVASDTSFRMVWRSAQAREVRRQIRDHGDGLSFCRNCPYTDRSSSDCSLEARFLDPTLDYAYLSSMDRLT